MTIVDVDLATEYTFTGLTPLTSYTLEVRARNATGPSAWVPVELRTAAVAGPIIDVDLATDHTFTGLAPSSGYLAEVRARNATGSSAWVPATFATAAPPPPDGAYVWISPFDADPTNFDDAVDFSCYVDDVALVHGRPDTGAQCEPSTATVNFTTDAPADSAIWALVDIGAYVHIVVVADGVTYDRFVGRVTDLALGWDDAGPDTPDAGMGQLVATSLLADYARRIVGADPLPQELYGARVARVFALAGLVLDPADVDPGTAQILARDVDARPALQVAQDAAKSASGLVWQTRSGVIGYADAEHRRGAAVDLELDACDILVSPTWSRNLAGLVNAISVGYGEPEAHYAARNTDSVARIGEYGLSVSTDLADLAAAQEIAGLVLARNASPVWILNALPVDLLGLSTEDRATVLELEVHSLVQVVGLPAISGAPTSISAWVEGWTERLAYGVHEIDLTISDYCRTVPPPRWNDIDPLTTWDTIAQPEVNYAPNPSFETNLDHVVSPAVLTRPAYPDAPHDSHVLRVTGITENGFAAQLIDVGVPPGGPASVRFRARVTGAAEGYFYVTLIDYPGYAGIPGMRDIFMRVTDQWEDYTLAGGPVPMGSTYCQLWFWAVNHWLPSTGFELDRVLITNAATPPDYQDGPTWDDAACTGGPAIANGRWDDLPASVRWDMLDPALTWDTWDTSGPGPRTP